jgi:hypothetical protein
MLQLFFLVLLQAHITPFLVPSVRGKLYAQRGHSFALILSPLR